MKRQKQDRDSKMMNKALNSFLLMLVGLTCFMLLNILTSANYLYHVVDIRPADANFQRTGPKGLAQELSASRSSNPVPAEEAAARAGSNATVKPSSGAKANPGKDVAKANPAKDVAKGKPKTEQPRPDNCASCFVHNFSYLIQNTSICANSSSQPIDLLMLILTIHSNAQQRQNIRNSWASYAKNNTGKVRYAFLLGLTNDKAKMDAVYAESKLYGDILMEDFTDAYANLTYKTIMAMKWMTHFCPQAKYLLKTDDDMWVNVPNLLTLLDKRGRELEKAVGGACSLSAGPIRNQRSKWYASKISYPHARYPGFCSGTGYVTSAAVAKKVYEVSPNVPFFHLEDVYVALCIRKLRMELIRLPGFHNFRTALKPCEMRSEKIITSHMVPTDFLHKVMEAKC